MSQPGEIPKLIVRDFNYVIDGASKENSESTMNTRSQTLPEG